MGKRERSFLSLGKVSLYGEISLVLAKVRIFSLFLLTCSFIVRLKFCPWEDEDVARETRRDQA
jgi:hypothetical protein